MSCSFDLIFVYAIQKIAHVILTTQNGSISADLFFKYIVMSLFLWLMWSHQTFLQIDLVKLHSKTSRL